MQKCCIMLPILSYRILNICIVEGQDTRCNHIIHTHCFIRDILQWKEHVRVGVCSDNQFTRGHCFDSGWGMRSFTHYYAHAHSEKGTSCRRILLRRVFVLTDPPPPKKSQVLPGSVVHIQKTADLKAFPIHPSLPSTPWKSSTWKSSAASRWR